MTDPIYYRRRDEIPVMVWPAPDEDECIYQVGMNRPEIVEYSSLGIEASDTEVTAAEWHKSMASGEWADGTKWR